MQATTIPTPPQAPLPPAPPLPPGATPVIAGQAAQAPLPIARPLTSSEVRALRRRGEELSRQLNSATSRRHDLARELRSTDPGARPGLEQRIQLLDARILRIEGDIAENGRLLATARSEQFTSTSEPAFALSNDAETAVAIGGSATMFVLVLMIAMRMLWRRRPQRPVVAHDPQAEARLERLEQGIEAIALEVERISEGQRFMTRLMTEHPALAAGQAPAEPIAIRQRESVARD